MYVKYLIVFLIIVNFVLAEPNLEFSNSTRCDCDSISVVQNAFGEDSGLVYEVSYRKGKVDGSVFAYRNSKLERIYTYVNGQRNGPFVLFAQNGIDTVAVGHCIGLQINDVKFIQRNSNGEIYQIITTKREYKGKRLKEEIEEQEIDGETYFYKRQYIYKNGIATVNSYQNGVLNAVNVHKYMESEEKFIEQISSTIYDVDTGKVLAKGVFDTGMLIHYKCTNNKIVEDAYYCKH